MTHNGSTNTASPAAENAIPSDIRTGSPFAANSSTPVAGTIQRSEPQSLDRESIGEGVWKETAAAATYAGWMLILFATMGWVWFPIGGVAIALLGVAMSVMGLSSKHVMLSVIGIAMHVGILIACYFKAM